MPVPSSNSHKIDLTQFVEEKEHLVPIVDGWGQIKNRKFEASVDDGWYKVLAGSTVGVARQATALEILKANKNQQLYLAYPFGRRAIPANFDTFKKKGYAETVPLYLKGETPLFTAISIIQWPDDRYYFYQEQPQFQRSTLQNIRDAVKNKEDITDIKGVTPEQRYLYILTRLYENSYQAYKQIQKFKVDGSERKRHIAEFKLSMRDRLRRVINQAGGTYIRHFKRGNGVLVKWRVGGQTIKSHINDDMRILNAGFCLDGDDKKHSMASIVMLADMFQDNEPLYITRE